MQAPFEASLSPYIFFYFIYCCNFPWVCKTVTLFYVTLYVRLNAEMPAPILFCDYLDQLQNIL